MPKKIAAISTRCVACGCCVKGCPRNALVIHKGICAVVDSALCVGCGKCAAMCPGGLVTMTERGAVHEKTVV